MRIVASLPQRPRLKIVSDPAPGYWSVHTHSRYSVNDALPTVEAIVDRVAELGQPAVALTDHGNMAGTVDLYKACMKKGITPFPGSELYFVPDLAQYKKDYANKHKKAQRFHMGVVAYTTKGYENLVNLSTTSHRNHFHKPTLDYEIMSQLAEDGLTEGLAITTGCFFGYATQSLIHRGEEACKQFLATLESWFPGSVYVEIQNHNIEHDEGDWNDDRAADALVGVADAMGLPVVIGQDSHYIYESDRESHENLKRLVAFGPDPDEAVFPGDGFHLADGQWIADHHSGHRLARGLEGLGDLLGRHRLRIPVLDSYAYSVPAVVKDPQYAMETRVTDALWNHFGDKVPKIYITKMQEEFETIKAAEMAGYMMLVSQVTDWMRERGIIFQTRGSAAGSVVCWMLGISTVDPIKWDLRFERFLSRDRTKPPDIDLDVAHDRRAELIEWLDTRFTAHQIGSWALYSLDDQEDEYGQTQKGSLRVRYFTAANNSGRPVGDWADVPAEDKAVLAELSERKLYKGMGTNAAGIVITSTPDEFNKLVPLAYMARSGSKSGFVTQYHKDQIEDMGLVKLDVLGSKTLTVIDRAMTNLGLDTTQIEEIEYKDKPTYALMRSGQTSGVFQLEGWSSSKGCQDLKPNQIKDVIAAMALFRPAAMKTGGTAAYIKRKHKKEELPVRHELLQRVLLPTYGVLLYQEQVIDILRALGMDPDNLTKFLKAVKASNKNIGDAGVVIQGYQEWIDNKCDEIGMNDEDRAFLDGAIKGFAEYGFNRAHATVYGITAYRCAYLAARHPVEFHAALLAVAAGDDKEDMYLRATRKRGVRVLPPALNVSGGTYTVDTARGAIRKGLRSIPGVGEVTATKIAAMYPIKSYDDLISRAPACGVSGTGDKKFDGHPDNLKGVLGALRDQGLLSGLPT